MGNPTSPLAKTQVVVKLPAGEGGMAYHQLGI